MRSITSIGPRDVIHCRTLSEFNCIANLMRDANMNYPESNDWNHSTHQTCIQPNGAIGYLGYFVRQAYNIIPASEYYLVKAPVSIVLPVEDKVLPVFTSNTPGGAHKKFMEYWFGSLLSFFRGDKKLKEGPV